MSDEDHEHTSLGVSPKEMYGDGMINPATSVKSDEPKEIFPSFHYSGPKELHLPEEGKMEIHFCKTSETSRVKPDGSHWYECTIEVKCFGNVEGEEDETPGTDAEKALDTLARALHKEREESENGENEEGEY
jgi:hypothetical protein